MWPDRSPPLQMCWLYLGDGGSNAEIAVQNFSVSLKI